MAAFVEWVRCLVGLVGSWALFAAGDRLRALPNGVRIPLALAAGLVLLTASGLLLPLYDLVGTPILHAGGALYIALLAAMLLCGIARPPDKPDKRLFRVTFTGLAAMLYLLLLITSVAPLVWRYGLAEQYAATPDATGILRQSAPYTCGAASAVMVLHHHGVQVTEGRMAQVAGCAIVFGTDDYGLLHAMGRFGAEHGLSASLHRPSAADALELPKPFVASIVHPELGSHSIVVESTGEGVGIIDPYEGARRELSRGQWEEWWSGTALVVVPADGPET